MFRRILNLTPHPVTVREPIGRLTTIPTSGMVARVVADRHVVGEDVPIGMLPDGSLLRADWVTERRGGTVEGLPDESREVYYIVSRAVAMVARGRRDLLVPDTARAERAPDGRITAVPGFIFFEERPRPDRPRCGRSRRGQAPKTTGGKNHGMRLHENALAVPCRKTAPVATGERLGRKHRHHHARRMPEVRNRQNHHV